MNSYINQALRYCGLGLVLAIPVCPIAASDPTLMGPPSKPDAAADLRQPTANATVNLVRLLVERGVLTPEDAVGLIRQAEYEARIAQAQAQAIQTAAEQIQQAVAADLAYEEDDIRVTYVPEHVRNEIAQDVRHEVLQQVRAEGSGSASVVPQWVQRIRPSADLRLRLDHQMQGSDNQSAGAFPDFNAINSGAPFDVVGDAFSPQINTDRDRTRLNLRARLSLEADLGDGFRMGGRIATGSGNSPVSTNQTLGRPGGFSRYSIWLDRAWLQWEHAAADGGWDLAAWAGRFENPFQSTQISWDSDLGFDGLALAGRMQISDSVTIHFAGGLFPVFNTALNFPSNQPSKYKSDDRYLSGFQGGLSYAFNRDIELSLALAYYNFSKIQGQLSDPFVPLTANDAGSTDGRRPPFAQKGNTYQPLRDILPVPANQFGTEKQWQYFGLASPFRIVSLFAQLDFNHFEPFQVSLFGEYINNRAFDADLIEPIAVNNRGPLAADGAPGSFDGGGRGWIIALQAGHAALQQRGDWRLRLDYRMVESDAFVDGFVDSDFGMGGTNVKGYSISAQIAWTRAISFGFRWMSAAEVTGPPLRTDIFHFDVNSKF